jgi:SAF domain
MIGNKSSRKRPIELLLSASVIAGSVIGAWFVIESAKITEVYLVTKSDLASGTALTEQGLETTDLALFSLGSQYLQAGQLPIGSYLTRTISAGEVIPISAVTTQQLDDYSNIVLTPTVEISSAITPGSKVSVWASPALDYQSFGEPTIAALDVEVVQVREPEGSFASVAKSVELRVPITSIQSILRAIANRDAIALTASNVSVGN